MENWQTICSYAEKCGLSFAQASELYGCFKQISNDPRRRENFDQCLELSRLKQITEETLTQNFPKSELAQIHLLLILSLYPTAEDVYRKNSWPITMWQDISTDVSIWVKHHQENYGTVGLQWRILNWELAVFSGSVIQLGRLQCNTSHYFKEAFSVYRNPVDDTVRLAEHAPEQDWVCELTHGDPVINMHIPASGTMDINACKQSIRRMADFFDQFLPDYKYRAIFCESWFLDQQLQELLPAHSNIVRFQKLGHLFDYSSESETIWRVFGEKGAHEGVNAVPHQTSMQKSLAGFVNRGGKFRTGGLIILPDEIRSDRF